MAFKLGGTHAVEPLPVLDNTIPKPAPVTASAEVVQQGEVMYQRHCAYCHGEGFRTGGVNPDLRRSPPGIHALWQEIARDGLFSSAGMVGFGQFLTEEDAEAIRQFTLSEANRVYALQEADRKASAGEAAR